MRQVIEPVPPAEGGQIPLNPVAQTLGPIMNAEAIKEWKVKDCTARRILLATIELKLQNTLVGCKTAFQIWTRLNSQHDKCAANNKYVVQRNFLPMTIKKVCSPLHKRSKTILPTRYFINPGHDAMSHISAIETIAEQLRNKREPQTRLQICTKIIYTLPEHLRDFISVWESLSEKEQTIPLLTAKILNEESKNAMFKPQNLDLGYNATSNRGRRGGQSNGRGGFSGGDRSYDGPPAAKKPRYNESLCEYCQPRGFIATHPFAECRKHAHAVKRESANAAVSRSQARFGQRIHLTNH
jgi:uncharacterized membrane protein YgcG